jgi:hypothetical protein
MTDGRLLQLLAKMQSVICPLAADHRRLAQLYSKVLKVLQESITRSDRVWWVQQSDSPRSSHADSCKVTTTSCVLSN